MIIFSEYGKIKTIGRGGVGEVQLVQHVDETR